MIGSEWRSSLRMATPSRLTRYAALNATPRKCLGFRTPAEVFTANLLGRGHRREKLSRQPKSHWG